MKHRHIQIAVIFLSVFLLKTPGFCHCEIPCGIYDDEMRVDMILEHIATIEKAMGQIIQLQKEDSINYNQLVRWINNKDDHANRLQEIVSQYFMTQRIKPDTKDYLKKLSILHQMLVSAMKCKQTTDLSNVEALKKLLKQFRDVYFTP